MSFPFFDDMPAHETQETPRLRVVPEPRHTPRYRVTPRGWFVLWVLWLVVSYVLSPVVEFWWTKF